MYNLRQDPFEYYDQTPGPRATMFQQKSYILHVVTDLVVEHMQTLKEYPPAQKALPSTAADVLEAIQRGGR